ncbi:hypothetical protein AAFC00_005452 [Neodothiora populina]|uniref:Dihydroxyacetone kinase n=1 Tax=Neodothiora populina TaxID=2781224 RepID=A0ABR3PKX1_9PEZI
MANKHFFPDTAGVVVLGLQSLVSRNPNHLALDAPNKVVFSREHPTSKVSVISGGGSGHEPAWAGYVGSGMLAASVSGDVFASPSTKQVMAAIEHVPSDAGVILCITNYTGDNLHFGLAREKAVQLGYEKIGMLRMTDDVGLGRKQTTNLGRRGLAGNMFVLKLCGAASELGWTFEQCMQLGQSVNDQCVTIGSSLDYCHIPGRKHHDTLPVDTYSIAQGIHNEPGLKESSPIPPAEQMISELLTYLLDPSDTDRAFVSFTNGPASNGHTRSNGNSSVKGPTTALLINNFGGVSNFELEALTSITLSRLSESWSLDPARVLVSAFETSLNAPGWSVSLLNISGISASTGVSEEDILDLLDAETVAPAWPRNGYRTATPLDTTKKVEQSRSYNRQDNTTSRNGHATKAEKNELRADPTLLHDMLTIACKRTLEVEPDLSRWDQIMGDGDCGDAVSNICNNILSALKLTSTSTDSLCHTHSGALIPILTAIITSIEDVGGSLAAILSIYLTSLTSSLATIHTQKQTGLKQRRQREKEKARAIKAKNHSSPLSWDSYAFCSAPGTPGTATPMSTDSGADATSSLSQEVSEAATLALERLKEYTAARVGGRTVMDTLIPFCKTLSSSSSSSGAAPADVFTAAVAAAEQGAKHTEGMKASFGRAVYVGDKTSEEETQQQETIPMDPGAWALAVFLKGMLEGSSSSGQSTTDLAERGKVSKETTKAAAGFEDELEVKIDSPVLSKAGFA